MTLVLKPDLDMVLIYHCAENKVSIPSPSKVTARTDKQIRQKHYLSAYAGGNNSQSFKPNDKLYSYVTPCFTLGAIIERS